MNYSIHRRLAFLITFVGLFFLAQNAEALTISPPRFELFGDPGSQVTKQITLINEDEDTTTLYSSFENFESQGESGSPKFVRSSEGLASWITAPESVVIPPGESRLVSFTINIPKDTEPGGNYAAIFWGPSQSGEEGQQISIGAKIGSLVLLTVAGDIKEEASILEFDTVDKERYYTALPVNFYYRFQNGGNDRIKPSGNLMLRNILGLQKVYENANTVDGNILPKSIRRFEILWKSDNGADKPVSGEDMSFWQEVKYQWKNFAFGRYTTDLTLAFGSDSDKTVSTGSFSFWVFPWKLLLVSIIVIILGLYILIKGFRLYNRWVIARAKAEIEKERSNS